MKRYLFHLVSAILLIIMLVIILVFAGTKQDMSKRIGELEGKNAAAEALLEKERAENKQLLEKERTEHTALLEKERAEKNALLEKERAENKRLEVAGAELRSQLAILEQSVAEMERRFQVVSARDVKMLGLTFEQTPRSDADAAAALEFADTLKAPDPAAFKEAAEKAFEPRFSASRELVLDADSGCVVDPVAAIVETAAKTAGLSASTTVFWDITRKQFRSEVTVSDPAKKAKDAVVAIGGNPKVFRDAAFQLSPKTTVFPFTDISLLSRNGVDLFTRAASIPVGGLYVHYFRVYSKGPWMLEYVFPENIEPESVNMNLLPLTPGSAITSTIFGRTFTFHFDVENKDTAFLVIADRPFFPSSAAIRLKP